MVAHCFKHGGCYKVNNASPARPRTSNQIGHIAIISRYTSCRLNVRNKRHSEMGLLSVACRY